MRTSPGTRGWNGPSLRPRVLKRTRSGVIGLDRGKGSTVHLDGTGEPGDAGQGISGRVEGRVAREGEAATARGHGGELQGHDHAGAVGPGHVAEVRAAHHQGAGSRRRGLDGAAGEQRAGRGAHELELRVGIREVEGDAIEVGDLARPHLEDEGGGRGRRARGQEDGVVARRPLGREDDALRRRGWRRRLGGPAASAAAAPAGRQRQEKTAEEAEKQEAPRGAAQTRTSCSSTSFLSWRRTRSLRRPRRWSVNRTPFRWSISWQTASATYSVTWSSNGLPSRSWARTVTAVGRSTLSVMPGRERQPSTSDSCPSRRTISGLTRTLSMEGSSPTEVSITARRRSTPTCGAARPTPGAACMVSTMSEASLRSRGSNSSTLRHWVRRTGSG